VSRNDQLYLVKWEAGELKLHAASAEEALKLAAEYLRTSPVLFGQGVRVGDSSPVLQSIRNISRTFWAWYRHPPDVAGLSAGLAPLYPFVGPFGF
jgi:hypothetical protein